MTYPNPDPTQPAAAPLPQQPIIRRQMIKPYVTYTIMGISIGLFILKFISEALTGYDFLFIFGGKINEYILQGQIWRLITPMFLHGSLAHIGFNMYALYAMGRSLEVEFGHLRFTMLYLCAGFAGNVLSFLLSANPSLGASTAIFGLLAAEGVFVYQNRKIMVNASKKLQSIAGIAAINFFFGLTTPQIDNFGHLGGLLGGALFAWFAGPLLSLEGLFPVFDLTDKREPGQVWIGTGITLLVFGGLAAIKFFLK